jgi:Domain of unknown function (DUF4864)
MTKASASIVRRARRIPLLAVIYLLTCGRTGAHTVNDLSPKPELTPQQVVEYQLLALQRNDQPTPDTGIEKAFRFASPANKKSTGPISHFISMVHGAGYAPLLNAKESAVIRAQVEDDQAKILTRVVSAGGSEMFYLFLLSRQSEGENTNCWLTDGVIGLQPEGDGQPKVEI